MGYTHIICLEILTHLWTEYGTLLDLQIKENDTNLKKEILGNVYFEEFLQQIENDQEIVVIQNLYTNEQILLIAFNLVTEKYFMSRATNIGDANLM